MPGRGLDLRVGAAFELRRVDAVPGRDRGREARQIALGDPGAGSLEAQHFRPVFVDAVLARLGAALQPFVGAADIESRLRIDRSERRRQILAAGGSQHDRSQS